jgi:large subunit ribosomal protein L21
MKTVIISLDGRQFKVSEGQIFKVNSIENFDDLKVLTYTEGDNTDFGAPFLENVTVSLSKVEDRLDDKVRVSRFRSKSRHRRTKGFRQPISIVKVESISKENK